MSYHPTIMKDFENQSNPQPLNQNTPQISTSTPTNPFYTNMFASGCGSIITGLTMTPLDVLGKRIQAEKLTQPTLIQSSSSLPTTPTNIHHQPTIRSTLRTIVNNEGLPRLWAGLSTGLVMSVPNTIIYFSSYEILRQAFVQSLPKYQKSLEQSDFILNHPTMHTILLSTSLPPFLAGVFSRLCCTTLTAPLELVRTRQQTFSTSNPTVQQIPSILTLFKEILYTSPHANNYNPTSLPSSPLSSTPTTNSTPLSSTPNQQISFDHISTPSQRRPIYLLNLYRGLGTTLLRDVPFSALYWTFNEKIKGLLTESSFLRPKSTQMNDTIQFQTNQYTTNPSFSQLHTNSIHTQQQSTQPHLQPRTPHQTWAISFISGAVAGTLAALCTHPFEVIKTAQQFQYSTTQLQQHGIDLSKANLFSTFRYITSTRGIRGLFTGLTPRVLKIAPSCAVMLSSYDLTKTLLGTKVNLSSTTPIRNQIQPKAV